MAARISREGTALLTFSSRRVVMLPYPGSRKSVMPGWFRMVRLVTVSGRCSTFRMPPLGNAQPVMAVPSKYTFSMPVQPDRSTAWVRFGQFRTSRVFISTLLPRYNSVRLGLE